jgi:ribosomal protein S18 acetylase RimI-like enzyme
MNQFNQSPPRKIVFMLTIRHVAEADVALICKHRIAMFRAMGQEADEALTESVNNFASWVVPRLADGRYHGWIAFDGDRAAGSAGLLILEWPPVPHDPSGEYRGYILNVYVEPEYRRRGVARELVGHCLAEASRRGIRVVTLHASEDGRALYESLGFKPANEMRLERAATDGSTSEGGAFSSVLP